MRRFIDKLTLALQRLRTKNIVGIFFSLITAPHPCEKIYRLISFNDIKGDTVSTLSPSDAGTGRTGTTTTLIMKQAGIY